MIEIPLSRCQLDVSMIPTGMDRDGLVTLEASVGQLRIEATLDYGEMERWLDENTDPLEYGTRATWRDQQWCNLRVPVRLV